MSALEAGLRDNWLLIFVALWLLLALLNREERENLGNLLAEIVAKPSVQVGNSSNIYSKDELEGMAHRLADTIITPIDSLANHLKGWIDGMRERISSPGKPWKHFGYVLLLIFLILFIYADAIAIANTLEAVGLLSGVPPLLTRYEIAVTLGSIGSVVVAGMIAHEIFGKAEFTDWNEGHGLWKVIAALITIFLLIAGLVVVVALGLARYRVFVTLEPAADVRIQQLVSAAILILVPVNTVLATILIHREGIKGIQVLFLLLTNILLILVLFWLYLIKPIGALGIIGLDVVLRGLIAALFVLAFFFFTPFDTIASAFSRTSKE